MTSSFDPDSFEGQVITRLARIEENQKHVVAQVEKNRKEIDTVKTDVTGLKNKAAIFGGLLGAAGGFAGAWLKAKLGI